MGDTVLAVGRHGVDHGPTDADGCGAEGDGFEDVGGASDPAVDKDLETRAVGVVHVAMSGEGGGDGG